MRIVIGLIAACLLIATLPASAKVERFPTGFRIEKIESNGATIHVRVGGSGPAIVLLHGFGDTGDMWAPAADRFYNELSANPKAIDEAMRRHYARLYARPGNMHYAFEQFATFNTKDAADNKEFVAKGKLSMPILALGADHSFGDMQATVMRLVGSNVEAGIVKNSGHWIMEEQPAQTVTLVKAFLEKK